MYSIKVYNVNNEIIYDAEVVIKRSFFKEKGDKAGAVKGVYDDKSNLYVFPELDPGRYFLSVEKEGYDRVAFYVAVTIMGLYEEVVLSRKNAQDRFIFSGNTKISIDSRRFLKFVDYEDRKEMAKDEKKLSKILKPFSKKIKTLKTEKVISNKAIQNKTELVLDVSDLSEKEVSEIITNVDQGNDYLLAKEVLVDIHGNVGEVTGTIYLKFFSEVERVEQAAFFQESKNIQLIMDYSLDVNGYTVKYQGNTAIFQYAQELRNTGLFDVVEPEIDFENEPTAITPPDFLFGHQWYMPLVNVSEAWETLKAVDVDKTYGDADVVLEVFDFGLQTNTNGAGVTNSLLADFNGTLKGGNLSSIVGNSRKIYNTYDFRHRAVGGGAFSLMVPNNNTLEPNVGVPSPHGVGCAGVASGMAGGNEGALGNQGIVGAAPNTRLIGTMWGINRRTTTAVFNHAMAWSTGLNPQWWADGTNYSNGVPAGIQTFPALFNTPNNRGYGASILSHSHTWRGAFGNIGIMNVNNITSYGRNKRGTLIFFAAGNGDQLGVPDLQIGVHEKVFTIAASSMDQNGQEVRASYSNWGAGLRAGPVGFPLNRNDQINGIDFCAPSHHFYMGGVPAFFSPSGIEHFPPNNRGVVSAALQGRGNLPITNTSQTTLTAVLGPNSIRVAVAGAGFVVGNAILIGAPNSPTAEGARITGVAGTVITLSHNLKQIHAGGNVLPVAAGQADTRDTFGGTSSACPLAAGIAALVLSANPNLTFHEVRNILQSTAQPIDFRLTTDTNGVFMGWNTVGGAPIIDGNDLMVVNAAPAANTTVNGIVPAGATSVQLASVANLTVGQVVLFGAESRLTANGIVGTNTLTLANVNNFAPNMNIVVGAGSATVLSRANAAGSNFIQVGNNRGFRINQVITIGTGPTQETRTILQLGDAVGDFASTVLFLTANLANVHPRYAPVVLANTEAHQIQAGPGAIVGNTINLMANLGNTHNQVAPNPRVWVRSTNCEIRIIKGIDVATNTITIDPLRFAQNNSPVTGGLVPDYSVALGFGRLDADAAVKAALNFNHNQRDLIIRNNLSDNGLTTTDVNEKIDSPDIWIRNAPGLVPPIVGANAPANYNTHGNTVHQKPSRSLGRSVLIRVGNIGMLQSFDYSLQAYVSLTDTEVDNPIVNQDFMAGPIQPSPNPASPASPGDNSAMPLSYQITSNTPGTFRIGTYQSRFNMPGQYVPPVAGGGNWIGQVTWNQANVPALPLTFASVMLMNTISNGTTTIQVNHTRGYKVGQTILVGLPTTANHFSATVQSLTDQTITLTAPVAGIAVPFITPPPSAVNHGLIIPAGVRILRLDNPHATQVNTAIAAPAASVEVADATHFMPGQYVLVGPPGNNTSEIVQIGAITYNNAGNDVLNLITSLTNPRGLGDAVTRVEGKLSTFILAEVTPHDGLLAGDTPYDNNNMSCKEVFLGHKLSFLDNSNARLQKDVQVDSSGTAVTVQFRLRVEDPENFTTEQIQFTAYRLGTNNQMETVTFAHNGANWAKTGGAWLTINNPVLTIGGAVAANIQTDAWFTGSFTVTNAHQDVRLCLSVPDAIPTTFRTIETYKIAVTSVAAPTGTASQIANSSGQPKIGGTQRMHVFADLTNMTQTATQAFGPIDTNRFRLTSLFSTPAAAGASVMAYAVLDGLVFVQENPINNTMNLIIQPLRQADINYTKVKYFIYRGLRKADFVDGGNPANVRATTNNAKANFLDNLHKTNQTLNPGSTLTLAALNWDNKPVEEYLDNYFFNAGTDSQLPVVGRGMELGRFHNISGADEFGFEIVLAEGEYTLTIADAQASSKIVDVSSIADANEKQAKREEILNYVDPAAYFGMHFYSKLFYPTIPDPDPNAINTQTYTGADIYTNVVSKFYTKNTLYIDIRNEHGYSFNYDGTYTISDATIDNGNALRVGTAPSSSGNPLIPQKYHHQDWPILIKDNQGAPIQSTLDTSSLYVNLPWNVHNPHPQVYVERGFLLTASNQNRFVSHSKLLDKKSIVSINEGTSTITVNAVLTAAIAANDFISILGNSFLGANRVYRVLNVAANAGNATHTDLQVEAGTIPAGAQAAARKGSIVFRKWTKDVGFSYPVQPNGVAGQRVNVAGVIKLRYYRRLNPNVRPITAINQGANQMTVAGDVSAMLAAGDYFIVRGATPVGNNHNDGEYQVRNAAGSVTVVGGNTQITVTTAIPAAGVSGEVYLSDQRKVKTAHYHDNIFGSLNALNRKIPISSMTVVSPTQTTITVKGDFLATANLNTTLSILEANIPGNNLDGLNIVNRVLNAGNTEITVQHAAAALTMDTTGYIQLIYSVWKSTAPTRWLSGFDKRFIDAKNTPVNAVGTPQVGFSYVGQTGIALETDGVIFYATPINFFEAPKKGRVPNSISINGGTSTEESFWKAMQNQNQRLKLHMTLLKIGATEVPVYDFVDYPGDAEDDAMKENFFALCLTKTEITQLTHAANQNLVGWHDQYLILRKEVSTTDDNGAAYKRYEVRVNGWAKVGSNVVEREIAPAAPIYVYASGENALVFASQNYPNLGVLLSEANTKYEEELRLRTDALNIYNASGGINTMVNAFVSNLNSISNNYGLIKTTVQNAADQLWTLASNPVAVQDDRWSYWARLHMRVAIRNHTYLKNQRSRMFDMLTELQDRSRGISSINFSAASAGDKKILLIAFDPFGLDKTIHEDYNIQKSSPGAASALSLHGQTLSKGGVDGYIQVVVFPVRYRTFQRDDLETMVLPLLTGANQIDMICTLHDNRNGRYDIERFASRKRGVNHTDNDNKKGSIATRYYKAKPDASLNPPYKLIRYAESSRPKFLKTTLPIANMIPGSLGNNLVIYNQSYATDNPAHTQGLAATGSGTVNVPDPNAASNPTVGSSGDFLFNEAFYRIASIREDVNSTTKTGHISLERIQGANDDFDLVKTQSVQTRLKSLIEDALAGL